jgi:hypothetical protein
VNAAADSDPQTLRLSIDAKATVKIGPFARGGKSRVPTKAADHDFRPLDTVTPVGVLLPATNELLVTGVTSAVTSDCLVDRLEAWWEQLAPRFGKVTTLLLNLDNGPECHSRRTQFMHRLLQFVDRTGLTLKLAYYPPYHSKYNPIERCWGILERHWNGSLLDSLQGTLDMIETMTWRGVNPVVDVITRLYHKGVRLVKAEMEAVEQRLERDPDLGRWFVTIRPLPISG